MRLSNLGGVVLAVALLTGSTAASVAGSPPVVVTLTEDRVESLALEWFRRMQTGQIDRTQLTADYNAQLTDDAVRATSRYLKQHDFGAPPTDARVLQTRATGLQTFYVVKLAFPRGDAGSLLLGFDAQGKITGISLMSIPGD